MRKVALKSGHQAAAALAHSETAASLGRGDSLVEEVLKSGKPDPRAAPTSPSTERAADGEEDRADEEEDDNKEGGGHDEEEEEEDEEEGTDDESEEEAATAKPGAKATEESKPATKASGKSRHGRQAARAGKTRGCS